MDKFYIKGILININIPVQSSFNLDFFNFFIDKPIKLYHAIILFLLSAAKAEVKDDFYDIYGLLFDNKENIEYRIPIIYFVSTDKIF